MKSKMIKKILSFVIILIATVPLLAQIEDQPDFGSSVPIDGGIVTVTLLAAAYGVKRRKEKKDKLD
jgi:hypothetical protein